MSALPEEIETARRLWGDEEAARVASMPARLDDESYDGPEPVIEYLSGAEADRAADLYYTYLGRQS